MDLGIRAPALQALKCQQAGPQTSFVWATGSSKQGRKREQPQGGQVPLAQGQSSWEEGTREPTAEAAFVWHSLASPAGL